MRGKHFPYLLWIISFMESKAPSDFFFQLISTMEFNEVKSANVLWLRGVQSVQGIPKIVQVSMSLPLAFVDETVERCVVSSSECAILHWPYIPLSASSSLPYSAHSWMVARETIQGQFSRFSSSLAEQLVSLNLATCSLSLSVYLVVAIISSNSR